MYAFPEPFVAVSIVWFRHRPGFPSRLPPNRVRQGNLMRMIKRLMALIALASPAALAQQLPGTGNVPAPDLFDSLILCSSRLPSMVPTPTVVAAGATASQLDTAIGTGVGRITDQAVLDALGYVIPPGGANCGQGDAQDAFTVANDGSVATDVAAGYSEALPKFMAVYGDPGNAADTGTAGTVRQARMDLERAEADDATSASRLRTLRAALAAAEQADAAARAGFNAVTNGSIDDATANPIYAAAVAEWMAKSAVTQSVADYNSAVVRANDAQRVVDAMNYERYVPLGNSELIGTVVVTVNGIPTINLRELLQYANRDGGVVAKADANGVYDTSDSNFDAAGNLIVPNRLNNGELESITQTSGVDEARTNANEHKSVLATLTAFQADNKNALLQPAIDEAVRRAQAEADHYGQQLRNALADDTNRNSVTVDNPATPVNEAAPFSIASRHAAHVSASNVQVTAEADLREAVAAREAATQNVIDQFHNADSFYAQLVARREALQSLADEAVSDASADGATPTMELTDAAAAAAEAVVEAQAVQATYQALVGDPEGPIVALVNTLLETDGDDGQALVDAISQTYERTRENTDSIDALTADTEDGAEADGPITANTKAIATNTGEIESLGGRVTQNEEDIGTLKEETDMNAAMISTNAGHIVSNAANIATNAGSIVANSGLISQNSGTIALNGTRIDLNTGHIAVNSGRIGANSAAIGLNSGMIADNRHLIGELSGDLEVVRAGVAAAIALSRMPSIDGGGISFGAGTFGGEMAYAVGFQVEREFASFDIGVTSSGGGLGAGVGVGLRLWH